MERVELLTVAEAFQLSGIGLTFMPDFPVPDQWKNRIEEITVVTPTGSRFEALAQFNMAHFNIRDSDVSVERRWRVVVTLPTITKDRVPSGSRILVSPDTRRALLGDA